MSRFSNFIGSPKEVDIDGEKYKVYPLKVKDLKLFKQNMTQEEQMIMSKELIKLSLQEDKDITDEEINDLPLKVFTLLMENINEVNGFNENESAIDRIKRQQRK